MDRQRRWLELKERKNDRDGDGVTEILSSFQVSLHFYTSLLLIIFIIYKDHYHVTRRNICSGLKHVFQSPVIYISNGSERALKSALCNLRNRMWWLASSLVYFLCIALQQ